MASIQEVFLVSDWEEPEQAEEARAQRAAQLEAQGLECQMITLYRIQDGCPVLLKAVPTEAIAASEQRRVRDVKLRGEGSRARRSAAPRG